MTVHKALCKCKASASWENLGSIWVFFFGPKGRGRFNLFLKTNHKIKQNKNLGGGGEDQT